MTALRQQATTILNTIPDEKLLPIIQYMQYVRDMPTIKKSKRDIDLGKYAGSAGHLFGSVENVEAYIKEMRSDERF